MFILVLENYSTLFLLVSGKKKRKDWKKKRWNLLRMVYIVLNCTILNQANAKLLSSAFPQLVFSQREGKHLAKREKRKRQQCWCCFCYYQIPRYRGVASTQNRLQEKSIFFMYKSAENGNDFKEKGRVKKEHGFWTTFHWPLQCLG